MWNEYWGMVSECYSAGAVSVYDPTRCGGFIGDNSSPMENCFWDTQTSGRQNGVGTNSSQTSGLIGLPTAQMQQQSTFTNVGWDFAGENTQGTEDIWYMQGYPALTWKDRYMGNGDGSQENPYLIEDLVDFVIFNTKYCYNGAYTRLEQNLDLGPLGTDGWQSMGYIDTQNPTMALFCFMGHFDGNGHVFSNLTGDSSGTLPDPYTTVRRNALFGYIGSAAPFQILVWKMLILRAKQPGYVMQI